MKKSTDKIIQRLNDENKAPSKGVTFGANEVKLYDSKVNLHETPKQILHYKKHEDPRFTQEQQKVLKRLSSDKRAPFTPKKYDKENIVLRPLLKDYKNVEQNVLTLEKPKKHLMVKEHEEEFLPEMEKIFNVYPYQIGLASAPTQITMYCEARKREMEYAGRPEVGQQAPKKSIFDMIPKQPYSINPSFNAIEEEQKAKDMQMKKENDLQRYIKRKKRKADAAEKKEKKNYLKHLADQEFVFQKAINDQLEHRELNRLKKEEARLLQDTDEESSPAPRGGSITTRSYYGSDAGSAKASGKGGDKNSKGQGKAGQTQNGCTLDLQNELYKKNLDSCFNIRDKLEKKGEEAKKIAKKERKQRAHEERKRKQRENNGDDNQSVYSLASSVATDTTDGNGPVDYWAGIKDYGYTQTGALGPRDFHCEAKRHVPEGFEHYKHITKHHIQCETLLRLGCSDFDKERELKKLKFTKHEQAIRKFKRELRTKDTEKIEKVIKNGIIMEVYNILERKDAKAYASRPKAVYIPKDLKSDAGNAGDMSIAKDSSANRSFSPSKRATSPQKPQTIVQPLPSALKKKSDLEKPGSITGGSDSKSGIGGRAESPVKMAQFKLDAPSDLNSEKGQPYESLKDKTIDELYELIRKTNDELEGLDRQKLNIKRNSNQTDNEKKKLRQVIDAEITKKNYLLRVYEDDLEKKIPFYQKLDKESQFYKHFMNCMFVSEIEKVASEQVGKDHEVMQVIKTVVVKDHEKVLEAKKNRNKSR